MEWQFIIALIACIPIVLFPVALIWYLNIGGLYTAFKEVITKRATRKIDVGSARVKVK
jgi:hypothetical protein